METTKELIAQTGHDKLLRLLEVSKAMAFERTLDRLLPFIADNVASTIAADRCGIFLLDKERKEIWRTMGERSRSIPRSQTVPAC